MAVAPYLQELRRSHGGDGGWRVADEVLLSQRVASEGRDVMGRIWGSTVVKIWAGGTSAGGFGCCYSRDSTCSEVGSWDLGGHKVGSTWRVGNIIPGYPHRGEHPPAPDYLSYGV